jgi:hypothetical protein
MRAPPVVVGGRFRLASPAAALALGVIVALLASALVALSVLTHHNGWTVTGEQIAITVSFAAVGVLVARRQPGNAIGWLMISPAVCALLGFDAGLYAVLDYRLGYSLPLGPVALLLYQAWLPTYVLFPLVILLFPDGRLPSPRWRWVLWSYLGLCCAFLAVLTAQAATVMVAGPIRVDLNGQLTVFDGSSGWSYYAQTPLLIAFIVFWLSFVACQVLSWRRSSGQRRQQLKWLLSGAAVCLSCAAISVALGSYPGIWQVLSDVFVAGLIALPAGIGVGILKYRLYDVDRIISRTLAYAIVTGLLVGVYAGLVLLATGVLRLHSTVAVAAATLAAAALFTPLRRRVQQVVDRRFNRARYDADLTVAGFATRLKDAVDIDAMQADLATVVQKTLEPAHISVWMNERGQNS